MRRAALALVVLACACTPTVVLGTVVDAGGGGHGDLAPVCGVCDGSLIDMVDLGESGNGDLGLVDGGT